DDWDSVRIFLEVARTGSFRAAAEHLGLSAGYLRKRVQLLESTYRTTLLTRHVDGRLTPEGRQVIAAAARMEEASFELRRAFSRNAPNLSGEV
ncbi:LysR family transcriptional regulator, partial [Klebsiella pneumoniae]|uniref:helix-turn-helix domain-containing protein n=1 Tax=Klebsiella pneumoniae TaxID=573 RepID=UPI0013D8C03C